MNFRTECCFATCSRSWTLGFTGAVSGWGSGLSSFCSTCGSRRYSSCQWIRITVDSFTMPCMDIVLDPSVRIQVAMMSWPSAYLPCSAPSHTLFNSFTLKLEQGIDEILIWLSRISGANRVRRMLSSDMWTREPSFVKDRPERQVSVGSCSQHRLLQSKTPPCPQESWVTQGDPFHSSSLWACCRHHFSSCPARLLLLICAKQVQLDSRHLKL